MRIDAALILCAGLGTRMGRVGKELPKPLWPLFQMTLLEYLYHQLKCLNIKKIFINIHHRPQMIQEFVQQKGLDIEILEEKELLGSGGAIHNLLKKTEKDFNLMTINSDLVLPLEKIKKKIISSHLESSCARAYLFPLEVTSPDYAALVKDKNDRLVDIQKELYKKRFITYSGVGVIRTKGLKRVFGVSSFFETVCDYKNEVVILSDFIFKDFFDLGELEKYFLSLFKISQSSRFHGLVSEGQNFFKDIEKPGVYKVKILESDFLIHKKPLAQRCIEVSITYDGVSSRKISLQL